MSFPLSPYVHLLEDKRSDECVAHWDIVQCRAGVAGSQLIFCF
jgi:hypothetical protein